MPSSLEKTEAILEALVVSVSEQNSRLNNENFLPGYDSVGEGIEGLTISLENPKLLPEDELASNKPLADIATSSPNVKTPEEAAVIQRIITEVEEKLIHHGRIAVVEEWRRSSVRVLRKPSFGVGVALHIHGLGDQVKAEVPPKKPRAQHIKHANHESHFSQGVVHKKASAIGTLAASLNYMPNVIVNRAFLASRDEIEGTKRWPASFRQWIRVAEWWFLKVRRFSNRVRSKTC